MDTEYRAGLKLAALQFAMEFRNDNYVRGWRETLDLAENFYMFMVSK